jgi:hypothetical protein
VFLNNNIALLPFTVNPIGGIGVVPIVAYHSSTAVLLWYLSTGAQYGALQEANYMPLLINREFVQPVLEATESIHAHVLLCVQPIQYVA